MVAEAVPKVWGFSQEDSCRGARANGRAREHRANTAMLLQVPRGLGESAFIRSTIGLTWTLMDS